LAAFHPDLGGVYARTSQTANWIAALNVKQRRVVPASA